MMATVHATSSSLLPLLESLEDSSVCLTEQTDAYLTIANRISGEDGRQFIPAVVKHFSRLGKVFKAHISSPNSDLSQAALQALGFCVFHSSIVSALPASYVEELLSALNSIAIKSTDKNTCTRALWVISKQNFPPEVIARKVPDILKTLETMHAREDVQSVVMEHEALNVIIRLLEQAPAQMGEGAVRWAKLVIPLVVHSASKVRLRAAAALEMGVPLLIEKQQEVAAVTEPLMATLIPELQKLFSTKNETNVLKLWPLFVKLLGKSLHRGGPFINSLLHLEELGFRSSSPVVKKIAFIAWKSLIDNFALNPDILCSAKRLKLLMQPLSSIQVRTESLTLTKLEVWWYLVVKLGPHLATNFEQVGIPLVQSTISAEPPVPPATPARTTSNLNNSVGPTTPKTGPHSFSSPASTPRMTLNSSVHLLPAYPSIQMLGLEMLLHFLVGPEIGAVAAPHKLHINLEPLLHPLLPSPSFFSKHSAVLISAVRDGFIAIGKEAPDALLTLIWKNLIGLVTGAIETAGNKKERQGSEVLTLLMQALQSIINSEALPAQRALGLLEATVKGIPQKILGSPAYQVANMDVLNGTPALFLILLFHHNSLLEAFLTDERFFLSMETLVSCGLSGPTSPLAFSESVLNVIHQSANLVPNKEHLWRMWSIVVNPLTESITQTNEVNQGDALEHNFTAVHSALVLPITHLLTVNGFPHVTMKALLRTWSELYRTFARCSALVATVEENVCCEELCTKMVLGLGQEALSNLSTLEAVANILMVIIECVDFSPYTPKFQQKNKSPHTPLSWTRKKNKALGNMTNFLKLLAQSVEAFHSQESPETKSDAPSNSMLAVGSVLIGVMSTLFSNLSLCTAIQEALSSLVAPLTVFYDKMSKPQNEVPKFYTSLSHKLEKLLGEILTCLQTRYSMAYDDELLAQLAPLLAVLFLHKNKQVRNLVAQFWNVTFSKAPTLTYPQQLKVVLSQVKQKIPIILPGFEAVIVPDDYNGPYSDASECSQLETKLSGVEVKSLGKRDSLLARADELKERNSTTKPVAVKLDFGSAKLPPREVLLEEEKSVDFVFIPPETKQRVLTEHQKEVLRTKRVDIPAMYNNLDASQDTTLFTQYSQSQDDSMEKSSSEKKAEEPAKPVVSSELPEEKMEMEEAPEVHELNTEVNEEKADRTATSEMDTAEELPSKSVDVSLEASKAGEDATMETEETSANISNASASSDIVSGTPQKTSSRRQSFITLEKFSSEGRTSSPVSVGKFSGSVTRGLKSGSQEVVETVTKVFSPQQSPTAEVEKEASAETPVSRRGRRKNSKLDSSKPEKSVEDETEKQPAKPEVEEPEVHQSNVTVEEDEEDCIPDTQSQLVMPDAEGSAVEEQEKTKMSPKDESPSAESKENTPPEEESDDQQGESQSSQSQSSQSEPRRSSRRRSKPLRPGESAESPDSVAKAKQKKIISKGKEDGSVEKKASETEVHQAEEQKASSPAASQTEAQSQGQSAKRKSAALDVQERVTRSATSAAAVEAEASQTDDSQAGAKDASQGRARYRTRRSSQGLLSSIENSESDGSETREENQKVRKNAKKRKHNKLVSESPPSDEPAAESSAQVQPMEMDSEVEKENADLLPVPEPEKATDASTVTEPSGHLDAGETLKYEEASVEQDDKTLVLTKAPETERTMEEKDPLENAASAMAGSVSTKTVVEDSSTEVSDSSQTTGKIHHLHMCPHSKRGRGRRRFKGCNCRAMAAQQQENDLSDSQASEKQELDLLGEKVSMDHKNLVSETPSMVLDCNDALVGQNTVSNDDSVFEPDEVSTPTLPNGPVLFTPSVSTLSSVGESEEESDSHTLVQVQEETELETVDLGKPESCELAAVSEEETAENHVVDMDEDKLQSENDLEEERSPEPREEHQLGSQEKDGGQQTEQHLEQAVIEDIAVLKEQDQPDELVEEPLEANQVEAVEAPLTDADEALLTDAMLAEVLPEESPVSEQTTVGGTCLDSPPKRKDLDAAVGLEVGQSPSSSKPRGVWSPTASPSTSILKKGQKRSLEDDTPSPLQKARRVSFANPIHQHELADDIDRRSPVVRPSSNSSPRSKNNTVALSSATQQKFITTPTKGLLSLSPRNLRSPGFRSSKKCLISEMSKEPKPIPKDCVYPALVSCSAPVEAVLPQLTSNMWPRGFGQLVRAKNIKTVGDLSALTPTEIKTLPIRSPKLSNVKKALKIYHEQQRRGRCDDLKGFDETEKMTSEPEERETSPLDNEEEKVVADVAEATVPAEVESKPVDLLSEIQTLRSHLTEEELGRCSGSQLVLMHEQLSDMMKNIVVNLQSRVSSPHEESSP
ncbi:telomere-associated protein RIF1 isoform X2 [Amia ocellicauda]|uniref:telomere-associated protein RIF1 isoform X2 n=1 Tax=Amia ocellicauda TaxID=2972642 RepID=UPI0034642126